ncbi:MAG: histone deacetylase [Spirochaetota bacterium]
MLKTGIVKDPAYLGHKTGPLHPETHKRLEVIYRMLSDSDVQSIFCEIDSREAKERELLYIHSGEYIRQVADTAGRMYSFLDADTPTSPGSYRAALRAAGGLCNAVMAVVKGELDNAFALVRPPGHHAEQNSGRGFCIFNNIAIAAEYARKELGTRKILIVDWDLHHGNGTQHAFETNSDILFFSTHRYPFYPGTGGFDENGAGKGEGYTINIPLSPGFGDAEYSIIYAQILKPIAFQFKPELVLVSAGFDIYRDDPLGGMKVTPNGFISLTKILMDIAAAFCGGKIVLTLEGGYDLEGLQQSVKAVIKTLAGVFPAGGNDFMPSFDSPDVNRVLLEPVLRNARKVYGRYWQL